MAGGGGACGHLKLMHTTTTEPLLSRIHDGLTRSKVFTLSLALHTAIVVILGGIVIVKKAMPVEDMTSSSGYTLPDETPPPTKTESTIELPPEKTLSAPPAATVPKFDSPQPSVIVVNRAAPTAMPKVSVTLPGTAMPTAMPAVPKSLGASNAGDMGLRFQHDAKGRIMTSGTSGTKPTDQTEQAVLRALAWLRKTQNADGSWAERNRGAMTGLALLCFLGHGEYGQSPEFGLTVNRAIDWVLENGTASGSRLSMTKDDWGTGNSGVYEHGIATYALGEYYTMTTLAGKPDERVVELFRAAVGHIVEGQGIDGGWMYSFNKTQSDTSVSGWQVQALKAAHLSELKIPGVEKALDRAMINFNRVQTDKGGYGYRKAEDRWSLTGVGVLCEMFWRGARDTGCKRGVDFIMRGLDEFPVRYQHEKADLYAWYYHTQALLMFGGSSWRKWNDLFSNEIVKAQSPDGSWPIMRNPAHGNLQTESSATGATYRTALSVLMLESYYRYLPANRN